MATKDSTPAQPKISQKMILRTAICLFFLAALLFGYRYIEGRNGDFDYGSSNSVGMLAAIDYTGDGQKLVVFKPNGQMASTASWKADSSDQDPVWSPDGKFIYFSSDRVDKSYHIYRWNPDGSDATNVTADKRSRRSPSFPASDLGGSDDLLLICGGNVQALDEKKKITPQVLPPSSANISQSKDEEAGGAESQFTALYGPLGTSFRYARWCKGKKYIAAIMLRDDGGEALILQSMELKDGKPTRPIAVAAGDHIDIDVNPKDGSVVYAVQNFRFPDPQSVPPQFIKNNKIVIPFKHVLGIVDPDKGAQRPIAISPSDKVAYSSPAISPDGASVLVVAGPYDPGTETIDPKALVSMPDSPGGDSAGSALVQGLVHDPSWSPDGQLIAFSMGPSGHRDLYTITKEGSDQKNLTGGKGNFGHPLFSPQTKAAPAGN